MTRILIPLILALVGLAAGSAAGLYLKASPAEEATAHADEGETAGTDPAKAEMHDKADPAEPKDFVKLSNQFVVPVVEDGRVAYLVVMSISLEVPVGQSDAVFAHEPRLRDTFLRVMFDFANAGGFSGSFTDGENLDVLRRNLRDAAHDALGDIASDLLITEIMRQDA